MASSSSKCQLPRRQLCAAIAGIILLTAVAGCQSPPSTATWEAIAPVPAPAAPVEPAPTTPAGTTGAPRPGDCLTDDFGIHKKVIITDRGVRCLDHVPTGQLVGDPLKFFWPLFVFDVYPSGGEPRFYQVGDTPRRESIRGWVSAQVAAFWPTRLGAVQVPGFPLLIYKDPTPLEELIKTGTTTAKPIGRASPSGQRKWMCWPIAESRELSFNGKTYEMVRLLFPGEFKEGTDLALAEPADSAVGTTNYSEDQIHQIKQGVRKLDLVFCVDNTASTTPFLQMIVDAILTIARRLKELPSHPDLSLTLVLYRDYVPAIMYQDESGLSSVTKVLPMQTDLEAFVGLVKPLKPAEASSEDLPEAVFDGVDAAISKVAWRGDGLSDRIVVLIGDNSGHEPGHHKNPRNISADDLVRQARERRVKIFGLCIKGAGDAAERKRHTEQWQHLAHGTGGASFGIDQADQVVERIRRIWENRTEVVKARTELLDHLQAGQAEALRRYDKDTDPHAYTEVVEFFKEVGIDLRKVGPRTPVFATGWCLVEVRGKPLVEKKVFLARPELSFLMAELHRAIEHLSPDLGRKVVGVDVGAMIDPRSFFAQKENIPMNIHLMRMGIPSHQGILHYTREQIDSMDEDHRLALRDRISRQVCPQLLNAQNDDQVFMWINDMEFGWIKESLFP
jgi:hypothetical protein